MALKIYKKRGRNGYAVYHGNIHASSCNKGCLIKRVRDYLGQGRLCYHSHGQCTHYYNPQMELVLSMGYNNNPSPIAEGALQILCFLYMHISLTQGCRYGGEILLKIA